MFKEMFEYEITGDKEIKILKYLLSSDKNIKDINLEKDVLIDGVMYKVNCINSNAFKDSKFIQSVKLPDSIKTINESTFSGCKSLKEINLSNVVKLGTESFKSCGLINIDLPKATEIGESAFYGCTKLKSINYPNVSSLGIKAFYNCKSLEFNIPKKVKLLTQKLFYGCDSFKSITIPSTVKEITKESFSKCVNLQKVIIEEGVLELTLGGVFKDCINLEEIKIPNSLVLYHNKAKIDANGVYSIAFASHFKNCNKLLNIDIKEDNPRFKLVNGNIHTSNGEDLIRYIGSNTNTSFVPSSDLRYIYEYAFSNCPHLKSITLYEGMKYLELSFINCESLEEVIIPRTVTTIKSFSVVDCPMLKEVYLHDLVYNIRRNAFKGCSNITITTNLSSKHYNWDEWSWSNEYWYGDAKVEFGSLEPKTAGNFVVEEFLGTIDNEYFDKITGCIDLTDFINDNLFIVEDGWSFTNEEINDLLKSRIGIDLPRNYVRYRANNEHLMNFDKLVRQHGYCVLALSLMAENTYRRPFTIVKLDKLNDLIITINYLDCTITCIYGEGLNNI